MVSICACDSYHDHNENEVIGKIRNCKVIFKGQNSKLHIKGNFKAYGEGCVIILESNCEVVLGDCFQVGSRTVLFFRSESSFTIGEHASIGNYCHIYIKGNANIGDFFCMREFSELRIHGKMKMDDWVYLHHHVTIYVPKSTEMKCGSDVGFSWYSIILAGSGHSTFDTIHSFKLENLARLNKRKIEIEDHVWIGSRCLIENDVCIGNGSIVCAGSVVESGKYKPNSMITGYPAKSVAQGIAWDRRPDIGYEDFISYKEKYGFFVERPSFYDEFFDEDILDDYYKKEK